MQLMLTIQFLKKRKTEKRKLINSLSIIHISVIFLKITKENHLMMQLSVGNLKNSLKVTINMKDPTLIS